MKKFGCLLLLAIVAIIVWAALPPETKTPEGAPAPPPSDALTVVMLYGSEKQAWIEAITPVFNEQRVQVDGTAVFVKPVAMGSGELIDEVLSGRTQAHLVSPASAAFTTLANAQSRARTGADLVASSQNVVLSPVVIALWEPMAKALGWPAKTLGWADIIALAQDQRGWAAHGMPQWGRFRFGHTHPEYSNSGLQSLLAALYAGSGSTTSLTLADLARPEVGDHLGRIEQAVVHYGSSTGFFAKRMQAGGPGHLSAAVLYENLVIEANAATPKPTFPLVAIYPSEGTFWSDHPTGIVERPWVTPAHRRAAKAYLDYRLARPQQERALAFGFRPAAVEVPVAAPIDAAHGADPRQPATTLPTPTADVIDGAIRLWRERKKPAHVVLVLDTSGSMQEGDKIGHARTGAAAFVRILGDADRLSLLPFSQEPQWAGRDLALREARAQAEATVGSLIASGGTALYDAIAEAVAAANAQPPGRIQAVVVLSDGADTKSRRNLDQLLTEIGAVEGGGIRVFTIAYGKDAEQSVLKRLAEATQARSYVGDTANIHAVFRDIATFF